MYSIHKNFKIPAYAIILLLLIKFPAKAQIHFSVELGPQYTMILTDEYPNLLSSFYSHALGFNFAVSIHNVHRSAISLNFSYSDFEFKRDTWSSQYYKARNSRLYNLSIRFKTFMRAGNFSPYFIIGSGIHFMNWADLEYAPSRSDAVEDAAPAGQSTSELTMLLGLGIKTNLTAHLGLMLEGTLVVSKSYYLVPFSAAVAYTW